MRWLKPLLFSALGLFTGCNGCDSCMTKQPGDVIPSAEPAPIEPQVVDAAPPPQDDESDAGEEREAAAEDDPAPALTLSAVPRPPDAPMPIGAFQSCGVYDGPVCERSCPKGNCRQDCDGVPCELSCNGGYCSQLCGGSGTCRMTCNGGHCVQVCTSKVGCVKECGGGDCE